MWFRKDRGVDEAKKHHEAIKKKAEEYQKRVKRSKTLAAEIKELERRMQIYEEKGRNAKGPDALKLGKMCVHLKAMKAKKEEEHRRLLHH